ncbi:MAG: secretin N-terminal domain-containing protein, partial [Solirubrobacterales bacterium]
MSRLPIVLLCAPLFACATSSAFRAGEQAERRQDYDRAVVEYSKAVHEHPDDLTYRRGLERARLRASNEHTNTARRLTARGLYKEALDEYRLALDLTPGSPVLESEMKDLEERRQAGRPPSLDEMKERTRERSLPGLSLGSAAREPLGLALRGVSLREAYQALGKAAGVNFVFDPQFQDQPISIDLRDVPFDQALNALGTTGRTFYRVVDAQIISVIPDTPTKRREFEQQVIKTLFLSNADLKETIDLLRVVLGARRVAAIPGSNALTINDTPDKVAAAERIVDIVDKRRAEVVVEVEILEVNRSKLKEYGIQITSGLEAQGIEGVAGAIFPDPTKKTYLGDNPYSKDNLVVSALPGVIYRLLQQDSSTRLLANPQIRSSEGQTAQARFGDQVPVPVTTFAPIAQGGVSQQPITSFDYKNVGVNIDITPRVHHDGDVSLQLKLDISAVGAPGYQGLPTFNSRTLTSVIRLKDGETNILAGLIRDDERTSLTGLPGLASVPFLGRLFAKNRTENVQTDIVMTLTPHVVRRSELKEEDLRSFLVGGESSPLLFGAPTTPAPPSSP